MKAAVASVKLPVDEVLNKRLHVYATTVRQYLVKDISDVDVARFHTWLFPNHGPNYQWLFGEDDRVTGTSKRNHPFEFYHPGKYEYGADTRNFELYRYSLQYKYTDFKQWVWEKELKF